MVFRIGMVVTIHLDLKENMLYLQATERSSSGEMEFAARVAGTVRLEGRNKKGITD
ncbi:MAG: hypothetical protein JRJ68_08585 [Deltaproteobacteria bacterium]|nr:hypothetical protein [Deltaproteobacteria bacterium]